MSRVPSTVPPEDATIPARHPLAPAAGTTIPSHFAHCFGCGELHPTGLHITATAGEGQDLTATFTVTRDHQGAPGLAHGGLLTLAFDEVFGKLMWLLRAPAVTARLETDFVAPVPVGSTLFIKARIIGQANRKVYSSAEGYLDGPDGKLAMRASALYVIVPMQHFLDNAPKEFIDHVKENPELLSFVDPEFEINP
jgi:acyl-coenzyme A thioesterase PaaI-like protein